MGFTKPRSDLFLFGRSLLPSPISAVGCVAAGLAFVVIHIILLSLSFGTILPSAFNGDLGAFYTNSVVSPLEHFINNKFIDTVIPLLLWGLAGYIIFSVLEHGFRNYSTWRQSENQIQMIDQQHITSHPMRQTFFLRLIWRVGICMVTVALFATFGHTLSTMLHIDSQLFSGDLTTHKMVRLGWALLGWIVFFHVALVLVRLYLFRSRLGRDDIYIR